MKQLNVRVKSHRLEKTAYFDAVFNNTSLSPIEQDEGIIQFYRNVATQANSAPKAENKAEPNGRSMSKAMTMFNGQGRGAELSSAKEYRLPTLCSITNFTIHERRGMSQDHRLDSAWFGCWSRA